MNSNGIPEMIRAAGKSKYVTPRMLWWTWAALVFGLIGLGMCSMAHASPACMTYPEARQVWKREYLHWHGEHCWSYEHQERQHVERTPLPKSKPFVLLLEQAAADPNFDIRWRTRIEQ